MSYWKNFGTCSNNTDSFTTGQFDLMCSTYEIYRVDPYTKKACSAESRTPQIEFTFKGNSSNVQLSVENNGFYSRIYDADGEGEIGDVKSGAGISGGAGDTWSTTDTNVRFVFFTEGTGVSNTPTRHARAITQNAFKKVYSSLSSATTRPLLSTTLTMQSAKSPFIGLDHSIILALPEMRADHVAILRGILYQLRILLSLRSKKPTLETSWKSTTRSNIIRPIVCVKWYFQKTPLRRHLLRALPVCLPLRLRMHQP